MQGLNGPMAADEPGQAGRAGAGGGQAGDAERGDVGQGRAVQGGDVTPDQVCLADMREWQVPGAGRTWMVRVVIRPCPRPVAGCATAT